MPKYKPPGFLAELFCWLLDHDFFIVVFDEEGYPRRKCERCGAWAIPKEHRRRTIG